MAQSRWAELPAELLDEIAKHIESCVDYVRCRVVCSRWNRSLPKRPQHQRQPISQTPWLMLPYDEKNKTVGGFYSVDCKKTYHIDVEEARGKLCRGSIDGWLVMVEDGPAVNLLNPITKDQIALPPISTLPYLTGYDPDRKDEEYAIANYKSGNVYMYSKSQWKMLGLQKVVLSSTPAAKDFVALAIYGEYSRLVFCKGGDDKWTSLQTPPICCSDIIFYEGKFYAISGPILVVCDPGSLPNVVTRHVEVSENCQVMSYLVGSPIYGLLMVSRTYDYFQVRKIDNETSTGYRTTAFKVYKFEKRRRRGPKWTRITELGDNMLFLGMNASLLVPSQHFGEGFTIYYSDNSWEFQKEDVYGGFDFGFFKLENNSFHKLQGCKSHEFLLWPPPVWVLPKPC
ncbi:hypothetical protein Tsubulata_007281 [Turnera subulata]|uniref:KIB1-4 beta-propeller domain-containing protein n=1 Tax=Turnera subulata TaxID=218843 RepID=A0A9Q0GGN9_9ROSI|nr:hypothetical protein Tsubulata_007281 [Turnera subulata]